MLKFCDDFLASQRILVVSPHADDETYGCAGSIARVKSLGGAVYVILVSVADLMHYCDARGGAVANMISHQTRLDEFGAVMEYLKVDDWEVLFTDKETHLSLDTVPRKMLVKILESDARLSIDKLRPTMVLIPATSYNQDHEALFKAGVTATRPGAPGQKYTVPFVLSYDNTSLFWSGGGTRFHPNVYVDISQFLDIKVNALKMHASQVRDALYHGSPEGLELATRTRGREASVEAAEGFCLLRAVF